MATTPLTNSSFSNSRIDKVYYGQGCLANLSAEVDRLGGSRVFIITGNSLKKQGTLLGRIQDLLGDRCAGVFAETRQHVPRESVLAATREAQKADADLLISFGGGTPNDTAKLVALCLAENVTSTVQLDRYRIRFQYPDKLDVPSPSNPCLPHISITTTLSAGEFTNFAGSTDPERKVKDLYTGENLWVSAAFLDPEVTTATPAWLWASPGIRAADHAIESVCSKSAMPFADALALEALSMLFQYLPPSTKHLETSNRESSNKVDLTAARYCQVAAWMSFHAGTNVWVGLSHGIGHQLGARANVPHGVTSCIMLPRVMEYNRSVTAHQQRRIAEVMSIDTGGMSDDEASAAAVSALEDLIDRLGVPRRLRDWGVSREDFAPIAQDAMEDMVVAFNPRPIANQEELVELLEKAL